MIGNIVLQHCLASDEVQKVTSIVRKATGISHPKLREVIHNDFLNFDAIEKSFANQEVSYFCIGVYTGAVDDNKFREITVDYTKAFADTLKKQSPDACFCFLSGQGADLSETSRISFARYKGIAENYLINKKFGQFYSFRPGYIYPVEKRKEPNLSYKIMRACYPIIKLFGKKFSIKSTDLGMAIFKTGLHGAHKMIIENIDIYNLT